MVSTPLTSNLDCTPVLHPIETPAKLPRLIVPMMSTPNSSYDLDHFPIHDLSAIDTSVEEGNSQVPVTHRDPPAAAHSHLAKLKFSGIITSKIIIVTLRYMGHTYSYIQYTHTTYL